MTTPTVLEIRLVAGNRERDAALALRHRVFCEEQGVAVDLEADGRDGEALHVVAVSDGAVVGTCRLVLDGDTAKLGRMAVEPEARGRGSAPGCWPAPSAKPGRPGRTASRCTPRRRRASCTPGAGSPSAARSSKRPGSSTS